VIGFDFGTPQLNTLRCPSEFNRAGKDAKKGMKNKKSGAATSPISYYL